MNITLRTEMNPSLSMRNYKTYSQRSGTSKEFSRSKAPKLIALRRESGEYAEEEKFRFRVRVCACIHTHTYIHRYTVYVVKESEHVTSLHELAESNIDLLSSC
jgi:hypothetical protein